MTRLTMAACLIYSLFIITKICINAVVVSIVNVIVPFVVVLVIGFLCITPIVITGPLNESVFIKI